MNGERVLFHDHLDSPVFILGISLLPCTENCCMKGCRSEAATGPFGAPDVSSHSVAPLFCYAPLISYVALLFQMCPEIRCS